MALASKIFSNSKNILLSYYWNVANKSNECTRFTVGLDQVRSYACKNKDRTDCRLALADVPKEERPCAGRWKKTKKPGILNWLKLKVVEGGTNFGAPFRRIKCKNDICEATDDAVELEKQEVLPTPIGGDKPRPFIIPKTPVPKDRVNVSIIGADSPMGHYAAMLLKQCPCIKRINLYEAKDACEKDPEKDRLISNVVEDLKTIDTNCTVRAFHDLDESLQSADIVVMLESHSPSLDMPVETRFYCQAPDVKKYADAIAHECPKAFVYVCISPIDCMVPLVCETMRETGWYDPRKVLGSVAVAEMRASTLAARALGLEPRNARVPCVGGTEGKTLVPLFSKAVEYFDFPKHNAELLTETVRYAPKAVAYTRPGELSEAHAHARLVKAVSYGLLGLDIPRISGFVETNSTHVISPARYLAVDVLVDKHGSDKLDLPAHLSEYELEELDLALMHLQTRVKLATDWQMCDSANDLQSQALKQFSYPRHYDHLKPCLAHIPM